MDSPRHGIRVAGRGPPHRGAVHGFLPGARVRHIWDLTAHLYGDVRRRLPHGWKGKIRYKYY